ncbi:GNAT family N-acetyltransferase [Neobacillus mesonae]|nr:GNAT family N-acetyltransferase [Neobacillus mesonae]
MDFDIRPLQKQEPIPYDILLLADPSRNVVKEYIHRGSVHVALIDQEVVGVSVLLHTRPGTFEIVNIAVTESWQGQGIGKALIKHVIEHAKHQGAVTLEIGTGNSSLAQLGLYQRMGFRITGIDRDFFVRHYDEEIIENGIPCVDMIRLAMDL